MRIFLLLLISVAFHFSFSLQPLKNLGVFWDFLETLGIVGIIHAAQYARVHADFLADFLADHVSILFIPL